MTSWRVGFDAYLQTYEVRLHRRLNTFGGKDWADRPESFRITQDRQMEIAVDVFSKVDG